MFDKERFELKGGDNEVEGVADILEVSEDVRLAEVISFCGVAMKRSENENEG